MPTYVTATTMDYARPSAARGLTATTSLVDSIVLNWQAPNDLGGATLLFYCIAVGTSEAGRTRSDGRNRSIKPDELRQRDQGHRR